MISTRRKFLKHITAASMATSVVPNITANAFSNYNHLPHESIPAYLQDFSELFAINKRQTNLHWFVNAKFGLFMHFGLYSLLEQGEWVQFKQTVPYKKYTSLIDDFYAKNFDADFITDLALEAEMKYINITSKHHDGFCLFKTDQTEYNATQSPAKRDLIQELYEQCENKGLGLFLYYSYASDWHHPYAISNEHGWKRSRPKYDSEPEEYKYRKKQDFKNYLAYVHAQLIELVIQYPNAAGIWLDPIMGYYAAPDMFPIEQTYATIRNNNKHALIAYKQGANGDEDYTAPERTPRAHQAGGQLAQLVWQLNKNKPREICDTLQPSRWGYRSIDDGKHKDADHVMNMLKHAKSVNANLLLNTGPLPDGSIYPGDVKTLKEVGKRIRSNGL